MEDECKTITQWTKDPRCPIHKMKLFNAIKQGDLVAHMPPNCKMWLVTWSNLKKYLQG